MFKNPFLLYSEILLPSPKRNIFSLFFSEFDLISELYAIMLFFNLILFSILQLFIIIESSILQSFSMHDRHALVHRDDEPRLSGWWTGRSGKHHRVARRRSKRTAIPLPPRRAGRAASRSGARRIRHQQSAGDHAAVVFRAFGGLSG